MHHAVRSFDAASFGDSYYGLPTAMFGVKRHVPKAVTLELTCATDMSTTAAPAAAVVSSE